MLGAKQQPVSQQEPESGQQPAEGQHIVPGAQAKAQAVARGYTRCLWMNSRAIFVSALTAGKDNGSWVGRVGQVVLAKQSLLCSKQTTINLAMTIDLMFGSLDCIVDYAGCALHLVSLSTLDKRRKDSGFSRK
jgi:hypothetical protein